MGKIGNNFETDESNEYQYNIVHDVHNIHTRIIYFVNTIYY